MLERRVEFQIDGFAQANTGRIVSSQGAVLAGGADITIVPPFAPQGGTNYALIQYPSKTGDFSRVDGLYLGHEKVFESFTEATQFRLNTTIDAGDLSLTAITSPTSGIAGQNVTISYTAKNVGAFDGTNPYVIDLDYWFRLLAHGDAWYCTEPLAAFRVSAQQWSVVIGSNQSSDFSKFVARKDAEIPLSLTAFDRLCGKFTPALNNLARLLFYRVYL